MPRYNKSMFNNDHKLAGFRSWDWYLWRKFLRENGLIPRGR